MGNDLTFASNQSNKPENVSAPLYPSSYDSLHRQEFRSPPMDVVLSQANYERFRAFVLEHLGLDFTEDKRAMLGTGLAQVMALTGCSTLNELYKRLETSTSNDIWDKVISALTVGETYFFRNTSHFDALYQNILPELVARRANGTRRIRIWSAGCATGEEPYSIAIALKEAIPDLINWNILILATDINREALRKAQVGRYNSWSFRGVAKRVQDAYFRQSGNQFVISDDIKRMVEFDYLNLVADPYPSLTNNTNAMDIIFCRNVTIYFSGETTQRVVQQFHACLLDDGWLIPGSSEPNLLLYNDFRPRNYPGTVVYQKSAVAQPAAQSEPTPVVVYTTPSAPRVPQPVAPVQAPKLVAKPTAVPDLYHQAIDLAKQGHVERAMLKLNEKIARDMNFAPAHVALGKIHANQGNLDQARACCERAIHIDKLHPEPYYTLSLIYQQNGSLEQAVDMLKKTIYLDRQFALAHYNLAQIYYRQNERELARKSLQNVQRLLADKPRDELVPEGDGLIVGRLLELVMRQLDEDVAS